MSGSGNGMVPGTLVPLDRAAMIKDVLKVPMTDAELTEVYDTVYLLVDGWGDTPKDELVRAISRAGDVVFGG